jgi:hypothetical protein
MRMCETRSIHLGAIFAAIAVSAAVIAENVRADDDTLRDLGATAASGEVAKWDGTQWRNAHDNVTLVHAGDGLAGEMTNNAIHLKINFPPAPIGSVMAWLKSFPNTPPLPSGWIECNGQVLNDADSVYNGAVMPNLNGTLHSVEGDMHLDGFGTTPDNAFDMNDATFAENVQSSTRNRYIGKTFPARFVDMAYISFTVSNYGDMDVRLQVFDGSTWTTIATYTSNKTGLLVTIRQSVQGIRLFFNSGTTNTRTSRVYRLNEGAQQAFLRGAIASGVLGGTEDHYHNLPDSGATIASGGSYDRPSSLRSDTKSHLPPYYEVVWIMRVK